MSKIDDLIKEHCPDGVEYKELQEIFEAKNGYTPSKSNKNFWIDGIVPWFRMDDIRKNGTILSESLQQITEEAVKSGRLFPANSIIISTTATIGEHALITVPHLSNQRFTSLSLKPEFSKLLYMRFIYYYCFVLDSWCLANTNTSSFPSVNMTGFKRFKFPIPPLPVQQEIVTILDKFTKLEAELETELEARQRQYAYYRNSLLSFDEIGGIVESVRWRALGEVGMYSDTRIDATSLNNDSYVGVDNLLQNRAGKSASNYVPETGRLTCFKEDDILLGNIRPYLKKIWHSNQKGGTNGDVLVIRIKQEEKGSISPRYLYQILADDKFFHYAMKTSKGAKMPRGNKQMIMKYQIPLPPLEEQARIVTILDKFDALVNDISSGLPAEITARRKQYEYYRNRLLTFREAA